jgi:GT2 family glycosyltransferase
VVIPSHNRPDLLRRCLSSVVRQAPPESEILVVDDDSPSGAVSAAAGEFRGVRVLRQPRRGGFCAAANAGIRAAQHPIVELLNDDTEVSADWAAPALRRFADPRVASVAPLVLCGSPDSPGPPLIDSAGDRYFVGGVAAKRGHRRPLGLPYLQPGPVFGASGSSAFYRREVFLAVGGFPEDFGAYFEDVDLAFRLHRADFTVFYEPQSRVWHRVSSSHGMADRRLLAQQARNEELLFWRNLPGRALLRALPLHLAVLAGKAWRRWRVGELLPFVRGRLWALRELPAVLAHRRRLDLLGRAEEVSAWGVEGRFWGAGR